MPMLEYSDSERASVGVWTISVPKACKVISFSNEIFSGRVIMTG